MPYRDAGQRAAARLDRRWLLIAGTGLAGTLAASCLPRSRPGGQLQIVGALPGYPFSLGVASGDPSLDEAVLWTRLAVEPLGLGGGMPPARVRVDWEVAEDPAMSRVVTRGTEEAVPAGGTAFTQRSLGWSPPSLLVSLPGRRRAVAGRPDQDAPLPSASPDHVAFAVASCQHWETGYYTAYRRMSEDDLDNGAPCRGLHLRGRSAGRPAATARRPEPVDVDTYRMRYALYRTDPDLQAAHAAFPFVCTWDDHEVDNDYAGAQPQDFDDPHALLARRAAAYQAYWEHLPLRRGSRPPSSTGGSRSAILPR